MRVTGIDLSLTGAGVARIEDRGSPDRHDFYVGLRRFTTKPAGQALDARAVRLRGLTLDLIACCRGSDLVVIEAPIYLSGARAQPSAGLHDRAGAWWMLINSLIVKNIPCVEVSPASLKTYALGKGAGKGVTKDAVFATTARRYMHHVEVNSNDTADALVLAAMGARHLGSPIDNLGTTHTRALQAVQWPVTHTPEGTAWLRNETSTSG